MCLRPSTNVGQRPTSYQDFGALATHLRYAERAARRLARSTFYGMARWQGGLEHRQVFLGRVVDIGAELFAISAAVVRAEMIRQGRLLPSGDGPAPDGDSAYELADTFARQSRLRVDRLFDALWNNTDSRDVKLAKGVLEDRYTWLEAGVLDPAPEGPWIADATPGPGTGENVARRFLPSTRDDG